MDTVSMNSENSKTSDPHRLLLSLSEKEVIDVLRIFIRHDKYKVGK